MDEKVVVFDKNTKEVLACVPLDGKDCIFRKDVDARIFTETEPVFTETQGKVLFNENAFIINV